MTVDPPGTAAQSQRRAELSVNLERLRARVARACASVGRSPDEVTVVAVTKARPASDVRILAELGVRDVGESRDQEARVKVAACADLPLAWHFVGQLQRNKAASVARYAHVVQSVDRESLVQALDRGAAQAGRHLGVCLQVDLDPRIGGGQLRGRGGAMPDAVPALAQAVEDASHLELLGLMGVAPQGIDPGEPFGLLGEVHGRLLESHPGATVLSAGMSGDLEAGIAAGATHVRIGSALLGARSTLK